jgi:hypothetical protein
MWKFRYLCATPKIVGYVGGRTPVKDEDVFCDSVPSMVLKS